MVFKPTTDYLEIETKVFFFYKSPWSFIRAISCSVYSIGLLFQTFLVKCKYCIYMLFYLYVLCYILVYTILSRDVYQTISFSRLPISKITTFGCEKENVRGISGCD